MTNEEFENLVSEALEAIPESFKARLDNVDVVVEDWPSAEFSRGRLLLGLYQGVPITSRGPHYTLALPDKISIYQGPIEWLAHGDKELVKKIVIDTVEHEIAHHFGISDERLSELKKS